MPAGVAGWLAERRPSRVCLIAGLLPLGLLGIVSAAIVVMTASLKGWRVALLDCAFALLLVGGLFLVAGGAWSQIAGNALLTWSMALILGSLTGTYGTLTLAVQVLLVIALVGLSLFSVAVDDNTAFWKGPLEQFAGQLSDLGVQGLPIENLLPFAPYIASFIAASVVLTSVLALLLGSWWAGRAGGRPLRPMFVQLRLGYVLGVLAALMGIVSAVTQYPLSAGLTIVLSLGFALQGLAVVHWHIGLRELPWTVFIPIYGPLLLSNVLTIVTLLLLAAIGFFDNWFNLRPTARAGPDV